MTHEPQPDSLNRFGDRIIETTGTHGADIASQRMDELDEAALRYALDIRDEPVSAVDLGCGLGAQGLRFSLVGVETTLVDILDIRERVDVTNKLFEIGGLDFVQKDARELTSADLPGNLKLVYSQRFIHYLTWDEVNELLSVLSDRLQDCGRIFVSASGLNTELGEGYPDRNAPPEDRYSTLAPEVAEKHDIRQKVCLYERADMERLLTETGFEVRSVSTSGFGNIKAIAEVR
jgi:SAM-dependent methyltransferase